MTGDVPDACTMMVDEVGIEIGIYRDYRLKSAYQPIFSRRNEHVFPVAVKGLTAPFLAGKPVPSDVFFAGVPEHESKFLHGMCGLLHLRNHRNIGVAGLDLFVTLGPTAGRDVWDTQLGSLTLQMEGMSFDPAMLVVEIDEDAGPEPGAIDEIAIELRRCGARIALGDFGARTSSVERYEEVKPDVVSFSGGWFRKLCRDKASAHLFAIAVSHLRGRGVITQLDGIETAQQLIVALEAGVDLLRGEFLAPPALAGTAFDERPLEIEALIDRPAKVIAFPTADSSEMRSL